MNALTSPAPATNRARNLTTLRQTIREAKPRKLIDGFQFKARLNHGWLLPYLLDADAWTWGRWAHWIDLRERNCLASEPIPQIEWTSETQGPGHKMLTRCLEGVTRYGGWQGWSSWEHFNYFMDWLLFGLGDPSTKEEPTTSSDQEGASERLYQLFNLETMLAYPYDYFGDMLAENRHGRQNGFFPTPMHVCDLMVLMQMQGEDCRTKTVCDPCTGTGRMLLSASNYSYRLYGIDKDATVLKALRINGWLYSPWLVKPLPFLETPDAPAQETPCIAEPGIKIGQLDLI